jgi:GNAT superfamily N-acetyltransferase
MGDSDFRAVEANLRESFRVLARGRARADLIEMPGVTIASLGAAFQMFNAAFLSAPVATPEEMEERLALAHQHFHERSLPWAFWICEDWLDRGVRRKLSRLCEWSGLRLTAEMPGMVAQTLKRSSRLLPALEFRRVDTGPVLADFRTIGSHCFHVPLVWFSEVFDESIAERPFVCWVGYADGIPVTTGASITDNGVTGIYNIATIPEYRGRGYGEATTRWAAAFAGEDAGRVILQSTSLGLGMYRRMGFDAVTRILVYNSF